jgi:hypothetical protein
VRETTDLPGKGLSYTSYLFKKKEDDKKEKDERSSAAADDEPKRHTRRSVKERASSPWGFFLFVLIALFLIYFGGNALGLLPPNLLTNFLQSLAHLARQAGL